SPLVLKAMLSSVEKSMGPMPPPMIPSLPQVALAGVGLVWACVLMAAGIACVGRRRVGRTLHLVYAVSIATTIVGLSLVVMQQRELADWYAKNPSSEWTKKQSSVGSSIGLGCGVVLGMGWPLFCLVWFLPRGRTPDVGTADVPLV